MPADYDRHTGGWFYDQRLVEELTGLGWAVAHLKLPAGFPDPTAEARAEAARLLSAEPDGGVLLADQLALGVMPEVMAREGRRLRIAVIVHHPLAMEDGRTPSDARRLHESERAALAHASLAIVPSAVTARALDVDYGVPPARIVVAPPGTDPMPLAAGSNDGLLNLLSVGSVVPRKDHGLLVEALGRLADLSWRLTIAGSLGRAPEHVARLNDAISRHGLTGRVRLTGPLPASELAPYWRSADLYVSSSRHEGYGMAIAEALSQGIPVVATKAGAVAGWVDRRAAIIVPSGDAVALRRALSDVLTDAALRRSLREGALLARDGLPAWRASAITVGQRLADLTARRD